MLNLYSALLVFATFKALLQHNTEFIHLLVAETVKQGTTCSSGEINLTIIIVYISHLDRLQKKEKCSWPCPKETPLLTPVQLTN